MNTTEEAKRLKREEYIRTLKKRLGDKKEKERQQAVDRKLANDQRRKARHTAIRKKEREKARERKQKEIAKQKAKEETIKKNREALSLQAKERWENGIGEKMLRARKEKKLAEAYDPKKEYTMEDIELRIGENKIAFCRSYIMDHNKRKALTAGGYNITNVTTQTAAILRDDFVMAYIKMLRADIERVCGLSKFKNVQELSKMAFTNIADMHKDWYTLEEFENLTDEQKAGIKSITRTENKYGISVKVELHDKKAAIDSLNKILGYNAADKVEVEGEVNFGDDAIAGIRHVLGIEKENTTDNE